MDSTRHLELGLDRHPRLVRVDELFHEVRHVSSDGERSIAEPDEAGVGSAGARFSQIDPSVVLHVVQRGRVLKSWSCRTHNKDFFVWQYDTS
jgi:hypothetical protein